MDNAWQRRYYVDDCLVICDRDMFHHIWRLSEPGAGNLGPACNGDGLVLGRTPLVERCGEYSRFIRDKGMSEYQWLQTQPYDVQREEGLRIFRNLHILK